jgi:hypothetical protein
MMLASILLKIICMYFAHTVSSRIFDSMLPVYPMHTCMLHAVLQHMLLQDMITTILISLHSLLPWWHELYVD